MAQLSATVDQYLGRTVDLLLYDGMAVGADTLLTPALVLPGQSGALITGVQKLVQRFLLELFTELGSMTYASTRGCNFMRDARRGGWRTPTDVEQSFYTSLLNVKRNLIQDELSTDPDDERFASAKLLSVVVNADSVVLHIQVLSQAGTARKVLFPLRVNNL